MRNQVIQYIKEKYGVSPEYPWMGYPLNATFKEHDLQKWFALILPVERFKVFGAKDIKRNASEVIDIVNVKASEDTIFFLSQMKGYAPGYHMNKRHWLSVALDGTLSFVEVCDRIDESYELLTNTPTKRIYDAVRKIPKGKVATYGQVAWIAGDRKMARAVGNALHKNPDPEGIPCYRVVNSKGELAGEFAFGGAGAQARILIADGIPVENGKVDLKQYGLTEEEIEEIISNG